MKEFLIVFLRFSVVGSTMTKVCSKCRWVLCRSLFKLYFESILDI